MVTILEFLSADHDRLDAIFTRFGNEAEEQNRPQALFAEFKTGLLRHIVWEEDILFPIFEEATGMHDSGPTAVMRQEHRQIEKILDQIEAKVLDGERGGIDTLQNDLLGVLGPHNDKEEGILYPAIDNLIDDPERERVLARLI